MSDEAKLRLIDRAEQLYAEWDTSGDDASELIDAIVTALMDERAARDTDWIKMLSAAVRASPPA